ncbi:MAG TPA: hypothetical protein VHL31_14255 [Geminicoccus sp.]|jgi:hypothetical protein|uniref:hypothetical protein n=1 Tax=Geminicoccus sp. TaxID=2024832 RepID=UPI002E357BAA|nr:hypothetical protein [Geminicoccus sp.]HEX2527446.1 hypothetical protein [Geminicoccus sp.]
MRDLVHNLGVVPMVAPAVLSATTTSDPVDLLDFGSAMLVINTGAIAGAGDFTVKLQHSDTTTGSDFIDVAADALIGSLPASLTANSVSKVGYWGHRRYLRAVLTKNSGTSIAAGAMLVKAHARNRPVA